MENNFTVWKICGMCGKYVEVDLNMWNFFVGVENIVTIFCWCGKCVEGVENMWKIF